VCPQQRQVYVGMFRTAMHQFDPEPTPSLRSQIMRERLGASRVRSLRSPLARPGPAQRAPFMLAITGATPTHTKTPH
jgi:hypothetical protein